MKLIRHSGAAVIVSFLTLSVLSSPALSQDELPIINPINNPPVQGGPLTPPANPLPAQPEAPLIPIGNVPEQPIIGGPAAPAPAQPVAPEQPADPCQVTFYRLNPNAPETYAYFKGKPVTAFGRAVAPVTQAAASAARVARDQVLGVLLSIKHFLPIFASDSDVLAKAGALSRSYYPNRVLETDAADFVISNIQAEVAAHVQLVKRYPSDVQKMIDKEATLDLNIQDLEQALPRFKRERAANTTSQKSFPVRLRQLDTRESVVHEFASPELLQTALATLKKQHQELVSLRASQADSFRFRARAQALSIEQLETYRNELLAQAMKDKETNTRTPQALVDLVGQIQAVIGGPDGKIPTQYRPPVAAFQGIQWQKFRKSGQQMAQMSLKGLQDLGLLAQDSSGNLVPLGGNQPGQSIGQGILQAIQSVTPEQKAYLQSRFERINRAIFNWKTGAWSIGVSMFLHYADPNWQQQAAQVPTDLFNLWYNRRSTLRDRIAESPDETTYDNLMMQYLQSKYASKFTIEFNKKKEAILITDKKTGQIVVSPEIQADIVSLRKAHNAYNAQVNLENDVKSKLTDSANADVIGSNSWNIATAKETDEKVFGQKIMLLMTTTFPKSFDPAAQAEVTKILAETNQNKQWTMVNEFGSKYPTQGALLQARLQDHWNQKMQNFYYNGYPITTGGTTTTGGSTGGGNSTTPIGNVGGTPVLPPIIQTGPTQPGQPLPPFHILQ